MRRDVVRSGIAVRLGHPARAETNEHPSEAPGARRVVAVAGLAGPTREVHDKWDDQLWPDRLEEPALFECFRIAKRFGDHPRKAEWKNSIGEYPVWRTFERDDIGQPDKADLRRRIVRFQMLTEHPCRGRDEYKAAVTLSLHRAVRRLRKIEATVQVDTQHAPPV